MDEICVLTKSKARQDSHDKWRHHRNSTEPQVRDVIKIICDSNAVEKILKQIDSSASLPQNQSNEAFPLEDLRAGIMVIAYIAARHLRAGRLYMPRLETWCAILVTSTMIPCAKSYRENGVLHAMTKSQHHNRNEPIRTQSKYTRPMPRTDKCTWLIRN